MENDNEVDEMGGEEFLRRELARLESLEDLLQDIEEYCHIEDLCEDDDEGKGNAADDNDDDFGPLLLDDLEKLDELFSLLEYSDGDDDGDNDFENVKGIMTPQSGIRDTNKVVDDEDDTKFFAQASKALEKALLQGVVPVDASVGRDTIPGDWGFDPLHLANKDYIRQAQYRLLQFLPGGNPHNDPPPPPRPAALVLRDYREAEIRHGRLAMLAVVFWPLQEKLDQLLLDEDQFGPILYGPVTLPYFPLLLTLIMLLLGYLDIYAKAIHEEEMIGDAFLPGDCFWDPLRVLEGAPPSMKRNMQEREILNGRMAMIAFAAFVFEEAASHRALVAIPSNELLFEPLYQVSFVQEWLDQQFSNYH
jgi:light-harvesting complex I chlorophyll a/b binding protein 1